MITEKITENRSFVNVDMASFWKDNLAKGSYEAEKVRILEPLTDVVLSSFVAKPGVIPEIGRPSDILERLSTKDYRRLFAKDLGINLKLKNTTPARKNELMITFLVDGVKKIYDKRLSSKDNLDSNNLAKEVEKQYGWNTVVEKFIKYLSSAKSKAERNKDLRMKKRTAILLYVKENKGKLTSNQMAIALEVSPTTLTDTVNKYKLDEEKKEAIPKKSISNPDSDETSSAKREEKDPFKDSEQKLFRMIGNKVLETSMSMFMRNLESFLDDPTKLILKSNLRTYIGMTNEKLKFLTIQATTPDEIEAQEAKAKEYVITGVLMTIGDDSNDPESGIHKKIHKLMEKALKAEPHITPDQILDQIAENAQKAMEIYFHPHTKPEKTSDQV